MPLKKVVTTSKTREPTTASTLDVETKSKLYTLIEAFLLLNTSPTDEQVHSLSDACGIHHAEFEAVVYEFFSDTLGKTDDVLFDPDDDGEPVDESLQASGDPLKDAAEADGAPDSEPYTSTDPLKDASEKDGAPDNEQVTVQLDKDK